MNVGFLATTGLKETEAFWRNYGGYPLWLRDYVLFFYYPMTMLLLIFQSLTTVGFSITMIRNRRREGFYGVLIMLPSWLLTFVALGLLMANNIINYLEGRPLHWHAG